MNKNYGLKERCEESIRDFIINRAKDTGTIEFPPLSISDIQSDYQSYLWNYSLKTINSKTYTGVKNLPTSLSWQDIVRNLFPDWKKEIDKNGIERTICPYAVSWTNFSIFISQIQGKILESSQPILDLDISNFIFEKPLLNWQGINSVVTANNTIFYTELKIDRIAKYRSSFENSIFSKDVVFSGSIGYLNLAKSYSHGFIKFSSSTNIDSLNIVNAVVNQEICFDKIEFSEDFNLENISLSSISFNECVFHKALSLKNSMFKNSVSFNKSRFKGYSNFSDTQFCTVDFSQTNFEGDTNFKGCKINKSGDFENSIFSGTVDFKKSYLKNVNFSYTTFHKEVDFKGATFKNMPPSKKKTSSSFFKNAIFNSRVPLWGCTFKGNFTLENIKMTSDTHIYFGNSKGELVQIINSVINGRLDFEEDNITKIDFKGSVINGTMNLILFNSLPYNWETAVILKNEELKRNNIIKALEYKAKEKDLYRDSLKRLEKKTWQNQGEIVALYLSRFTNNHGQNWLKATGVTLVFFGLIPFTLFYAPSPFYNSNWCQEMKETIVSLQFLADFIDYFNPTRYNLLIEGYLENTKNTTHWVIKSFGAIIFILGKIFIPFGVFEVIQAFRKFNGKA